MGLASWSDLPWGAPTFHQERDTGHSMTNTGDSNILDQQQTIYRETTHSTMESVDSTKKEATKRVRALGASIADCVKEGGWERLQTFIGSMSIRRATYLLERRLQYRRWCWWPSYERTAYSVLSESVKTQSHLLTKTVARIGGCARMNICRDSLLWCSQSLLTATSTKTNGG
jgi:hypothetical protein